MSRIRSFAGLIAVAVLFGAPSLALAQTWSVTSGDWSIPANWGGTLPESSYGNDYIGNGGTATLTTGGSCGGLYVGSGRPSNHPRAALICGTGSGGGGKEIVGDATFGTGYGIVVQSGGNNGANGFTSSLYIADGRERRV